MSNMRTLIWQKNPSKNEVSKRFNLKYKANFNDYNHLRKIIWPNSLTLHNTHVNAGQENWLYLCGLSGQENWGKKGLRSSIKETRNHKYLTFTSLRHHSVSNLTTFFNTLKMELFFQKFSTIYKVPYLLENPGILK